MKNFAIIILLSVCWLNLASGNPILKAFDDCGKEANIPSDAKLQPDDDQYACIVKCVYTKVGVHDSEGKLIMSGLEKILSKKFTDDEKKRINECEEEFKNLNQCTMVSKTQHCIGKIFHNVQ